MAFDIAFHDSERVGSKGDLYRQQHQCNLKVQIFGEAHFTLHVGPETNLRGNTLTAVINKVLKEKLCVYCT